jgi:hypothetical protein
MPRIVMPALKAFELPPAGSHLGTLYGVVELGTQRTEFEGRIDHKPQLRLQFELPDERMSTGRPFAIGRTYTLSSHERSALRQNVEAWLGRVMTAEELNGGLDLAERVGMVAVLGIKHEQSRDGRAYVNLVSLGKPPKGVPEWRALIHATIVFSLTEFDPHAYAALPDRLRERIARSPEYKAVTGQASLPATSTSERPQQHLGQPTRATEGQSSTPPAGEQSSLLDKIDDDIPF